MGDQIKTNKMGGVCGTYRGQERYIRGFWWGEYLREIDHLEDLGVDHIRVGFRERGWRVMDWIAVAEDRDRWRAFVNAVMNLWGP